MRVRPHAFLRLGDRWINLSLVTDIEDHGEELRVFMSSDMARLAGSANPQPMDVARRVSITAAADVEKLRRWLMLNDAD